MNRNATATILIVLALGIYFTFTKGMMNKTKEIRAVNSEYLSAINNAEQLIKVRDNILKDWRNISPADQERLDKMIPNTVDNIRLIIDLNSVALRYGFSLRNIKASASQTAPKLTSATPISSSGAGGLAPTAIIATPTLDTVTVSFGVSAPYNQFLSFLQDLEANLRIMDITHLTVSANDSGIYDFGVEMKTYWLRQ